MVHVWYYSHVTKACLISQIRRDGVYPGTSRRVVSSSEWGWVGLLSGSAAGEVLPIRPDSKDPEDFTRLPAAFSRGSDLNREPQPSLDTIAGNVATLTTQPPRRRSSVVFGGVPKCRGLEERKKNTAGLKVEPASRDW